jgi:hypothetical protein
MCPRQCHSFVQETLAVHDVDHLERVHIEFTFGVIQDLQLFFHWRVGSVAVCCRGCRCTFLNLLTELVALPPLSDISESFKIIINIK